MADDALWYEAANLVGITNALNVVADGLGSIARALLAPVEDPSASPAVQVLFAEIRAFYACEEVPVPFAIMANDPHRAIILPSLRYWAHLVAPGWNVIGAGEPALPGVSVGETVFEPLSRGAD